MRMNLTLIAISLLILLAGILCVNAMHTNLDALTTDANAAVNALPADTASAQAALDRFSDRWNATESLWQLFAIHEDLDDITQALLEARNALESDDPQSAASACDQLLLSLRTIRRKEAPSAGNIF